MWLQDEHDDRRYQIKYLHMWISANYSKTLLFGHKQNSLTQIWFQMSDDILYEPVLIKYAIPNYLVQ